MTSQERLDSCQVNNQLHTSVLIANHALFNINYADSSNRNQPSSIIGGLVAAAGASKINIGSFRKRRRRRKEAEKSLNKMDSAAEGLHY